MLVGQNHSRLDGARVGDKDVHESLQRIDGSLNESGDPVSLEYTTARVIQHTNQKKLKIKFCLHINLRKATNSGFFVAISRTIDRRNPNKSGRKRMSEKLRRKIRISFIIFLWV